MSPASAWTNPKTLIDYTTSPTLLVWALCAATSIATSKHLLVDLGFHYPCSLYLLQSSTTALLTLLLSASLQTETRQTVRLAGLRRGLLRISLQTSLASLSGTLTLQALLHATQASTMSMLLIVCHCTEQAALWLLPATKAARQQKGFLTLILILCCAALLYGDGFYTSTSLVYGVLAMALSGFARLLSGDSTADPPRSLQAQIALSSLCTMVPLGIYVLYREWESLATLTNLHGSQITWLTMNMASSIAAASIGGSILAPMHPFDSQHAGSALLALAGITGCFSVMSPQRFYTSVIQLCAFGIAVATINEIQRVNNDKYRPLLWLAGIPPRPDPESDAAAKHAEPIDSASHGLPGTDQTKQVRWCSAQSGGRVFGAGMVVVTWIVFLTANFAIAPPAIAPAVLDRSYQPSIPAEVVISMYKEPTSSVALLISSLQSISTLAEATMHIYTKDPAVNTTSLLAATGAHKVTTLLNIGRESETYLYHILSHWDSLANHTLFVQAQVHNKQELLWRLQTEYDPTLTGMLDLGFRGQSFSCEGTDYWGWSEDSHVVSYVYNSIHGAQCKSFLLSYKGQFLVSASRIRGIGRDIYHELQHALVDPESWAHQDEYLQGRPDAMSAPMFGYTVERLWNLLFQCSDVAMFWRCPSSWWEEGARANRANCQCLDR